MWYFAYIITNYRRALAAALLLLSAAQPINAASLDAESLAALSLEELMAIEVISVAEQAKQAISKGSANFVISAEDIRRSGRLTVPEILRMAPGVHVARIGSNQWSVGMRGFTGRFTSSFLILLDGRSMYSRSLPGINWEQIDAVLHDIERIEIIRGPGASLWGSNAVHGVINIVTSTAKDTQGTRLKLAAGTHTDGSVSVSHGGKLASDKHYRIYAQHHNFGAFEDLQGQHQYDDWNRSLLGLQYHWQPNTNDTVRISGEVGRGTPNYLISSIDFGELQAVTQRSDNTTKNHHLMGKWQRQVNKHNQFELQVYYEHENRRGDLLNIDRDSFDFDFKQQVKIDSSNTLIWGLGYRHSNDLMADTALLIATPNDLNLTVKQAFIQNEIIFSNRVTALIGAKFEESSLSDFEIQPSLKLGWTINRSHRSWFSIAKAVRTPTRAGTQVAINIPSLLLQPNTVSNPFGVPLLAQLTGNSNLESEELIAYEFGHNWAKDNKSVNVSFFYNDYDKLQGTQFGAFRCHPSDTVSAIGACPVDDRLIVAPLVFDNSVAGHTLGLELDSNWSPTSNLNIRFNYSYVDYHLEFEPSPDGFRNELAEQRNLNHLANLQLTYDLSPALSLHGWLRYAGDIQGIPNLGPGFDAYSTIDLQLDWILSSRARLTFSALNLVDDDHLELSSELGEIQHLPVPRMFRLAIELSF